MPSRLPQTGSEWLHRRFTGLWQHQDFRQLWGAQSVSLLGSQVTLLALPLTAVLALNATPMEMGVLTAVQLAPFLCFGLVAGVWVDRLPRRPILIGADLGRAVILLTVPIAALLHLLSIVLLDIVAVMVGTLTVWFDIAYQSFLPSLVTREHLVEGNSKLQLTNSAARVVGPGLTGELVSVITAPVAILVDAASFAISGLLIHRIQTIEERPTGSSGRLREDVIAGLSLVWRSPILRAITACTAIGNLCSGMQAAIFILYVTRDLAIDPRQLGLILALGNTGFMLGAMLSGRIPKLIGLGPTIAVAPLAFGVSILFTAVATGPAWLVIGCVVAGRWVGAIAGPIYNVNQVSLRQSVTPDHLLGRMNASVRSTIWGIMPLGSLLGGVLGATIGLRPTLVVAAAGSFLAVAPLWGSPIPKLAIYQPTEGTFGK